jgi:hypothetical protein
MVAAERPERTDGVAAMLRAETGRLQEIAQQHQRTLLNSSHSSLYDSKHEFFNWFLYRCQ